MQEERAETRWWRRPMTPELKDWMRRRRTHIVVVEAGAYSASWCSSSWTARATLTRRMR